MSERKDEALTLEDLREMFAQATRFGAEMNSASPGVLTATLTCILLRDAAAAMLAQREKDK